MKNKKAVFLAVLAVVCYLAGIAFIINGNMPGSVVFYCLESVILVLLALSFVKPAEEEKEQESENEEMLLVMEQELTEKKQQINAMEKEIEELNVERERALSDIKDAHEKEKQELLDKIAERDAMSPEGADALLPPVEQGEKDGETIDIIASAKSTAEELESFAKDKGIEVVFSTTDESLLVRGNSSRMRIMFRNIIDNSIKYMNRSGKLVITISKLAEDIFIVLKDNGEGLAESETRHIFELNYQGSNRISGNGLGLTQAKAIVDYYGGTIYAKSNKDKGMGIYIQLPTT